MSGCKRVSVLSCITEIDECSPDKRQEQTATFVSPISGIVRSLMNSALSPRNYSNRKNDVIDENVVVPDLDHHEQSSYSNNKRSIHREEDSLVFSFSFYLTRRFPPFLVSLSISFGAVLVGFLSRFTLQLAPTLYSISSTLLFLLLPSGLLLFLLQQVDKQQAEIVVKIISCVSSSTYICSHSSKFLLQ